MRHSPSIVVPAAPGAGSHGLPAGRAVLVVYADTSATGIDVTVHHWLGGAVWHRRSWPLPNAERIATTLHEVAESTAVAATAALLQLRGEQLCLPFE
jgi:hypothetical protein